MPTSQIHYTVQPLYNFNRIRASYTRVGPTLIEPIGKLDCKLQIKYRSHTLLRFRHSLNVNVTDSVIYKINQRS